MAPFNFQLAIIRYFLFLAQKRMFFVFRCEVFIVQQFTKAAQLLICCSTGISVKSGLACACHPVFYLCTSTSLPAVPLFHKIIFGTIMEGLKYLLLVKQAGYSTVAFSQLQGGTIFYTIIYSIVFQVKRIKKLSSKQLWNGPTITLHQCSFSKPLEISKN